MGALTVVFSLLSLCVTPLPPLVRYRIICGWSWAVIHGARVLCGVRWRVEGIDNLPPKPCVIASRHESAWETVAFQLIFPPQVFVLKRKLLRVPFFGWGLARMSPIAIDRGSPARALRQVIAQGARRLQDGFYVAMFPEGTRLPPGRVGARHLPGAAQLAKQCGVPVAPVALNSGRLWGKNAFRKIPGVITVRVGRAIETENATTKEITESARRWIESQTADLAR